MTDDALPVQALGTTFAVVDLLAERGAAGVTELAAEIGTSKATIHNHLSSLERLGYLERAGTGYRLSPRFFELGVRVRNRSDAVRAATDDLDNLAKATGELATLVVDDHGSGVRLYATGGDDARTSPEGTRVPLHSTAAGKAILAHYPRERVLEIVESEGLPRETERTTTSRDDLLAELRTIRDRGVAVVREEHVAGESSVAAPLLDGDGEVAAAISVVGSANRLQGKRLEEDVTGLVVSTAKRIEVELG